MDPDKIQERLDQLAANQRKEGFDAGYLWAANCASREQIESFSHLWEHGDGEDWPLNWWDFAELVAADCRELEPFRDVPGVPSTITNARRRWWLRNFDVDRPSNAWIIGFVEGTAKVANEIGIVTEY